MTRPEPNAFSPGIPAFAEVTWLGHSCEYCLHCRADLGELLRPELSGIGYKQTLVSREQLSGASIADQAQAAGGKIRICDLDGPQVAVRFTRNLAQNPVTSVGACQNNGWP
jgi:hypothetical protein